MITYQLHTYTTPAKNARISLKYAQEFFIKMYVVLLNQKHHQKKLKQYNSKEKVAIEWTYIVSLKLVF